MDDLLAEMGGEETVNAVDDESLDLLDDISEDTGEAWKPADDPEQPEGIQGRLTYRTTIESDQAYGDIIDIPLLQLTDRDDPDQEWTIRGYHTVLRNQINKADPQVGDFVAIKYFGQKQGKNQTYEDYKVVVRRAK